MTRVQHHLGIDVLTAARQRIRHVYDIMDSVVVCFSGGKDSLVCLELAREVVQERGLGKVRVIFRDEELIPAPVLRTVDYYRRQPWCDLTWYAVPLKGDKYVLGTAVPYTQWDPGRPHVREAPEWAVTLKDLGLPPDTVLDQYTMDLTASRHLGLKGLCGFVVGLRADESIMRRRACMMKLNESYITATEAPNVKLCKPIYDWREDDVFKFIMDGSLRYCALYDTQHLAGQNLRVSTPLHTEASKRIAKLRAIDPEFYDRILRVFPDMAVQDRYWSDYYESQRQELAELGDNVTWADCDAFVEKQYAGTPLYELAKQRVAEFKKGARNNPEAYTPLALRKRLQSSSLKRPLQPRSSELRQAREKRNAAGK